MKIFVLGASGLVGQALLKELSPHYDVYGTYNQTSLFISEDHQLQWDISNVEKILGWIDERKPDIIISCLRGDFTIQLEVHSRIIDKIKTLPTKLLFCSTTNVFDGDVTKHHAENDEPVAASDYGQFKIKCENLIKNELGQRGVILRLPMVWGQNSPRLNEIKNKISANEEIEAYENIFLNHATDHRIAKQVQMIIENDLTGIFHLATTSIESQHSFIRKLVKKLTPEVKIKSVKIVDTEQYHFGLLINRTDLPSGFKYQIDELICEII